MLHIRKISNWAIAVMLAAIVFFIPLTVDPRAADFFEFPKFLLFKILAAFLLITVAVRLIFPLPWRKIRPFEWALFVLLAVGLLAAACSVQKQVSFLGGYHYNLSFLTEIFYYLVFAAISYLLFEKKQFYVLYGAIFTSAGLVSVYALSQLAGLDPFVWKDTFTRAFSTLGNPLHLSLFSAMVTVLAVGFFFHFRKELHWRLTFFGATVLFYLITYISFSRSSWLGLAGALFVQIYLLFLRPKKWPLADLFITLGIYLLSLAVLAMQTGGVLFFVFVIALILYFPWSLRVIPYWRIIIQRYLSIFILTYLVVIPEGLINQLIYLGLVFVFVIFARQHRFSFFALFLAFYFVIPLSVPLLPATTKQSIQSKAESYTQEGTYTNNTRISMWKSAIPWLIDHPFVGTGQETVRFVFPQYRRPEYGVSEGQYTPPNHLHNDYIDIAVTQGLLGIIAYLTFLILVGYQFVKRQELSPLVVGFVTAALVYLITQGFSFPQATTKLYFVVFMGIALALLAWEEREKWETAQIQPTIIPPTAEELKKAKFNRNKKIPPPQPQIIPPKFPIQWWAIPIILLSLLILIPTLHYHLRFWNAEHLYKEAMLYQTANDKRKALFILNKGIAINPNEPYYHAYAGLVMEQLTNEEHQPAFLDNAIKEFQKAYNLYPANSEYKLKLADLCYNQPDYPFNALDQMMAECAKLDPNNPSIFLNWGNFYLRNNMLDKAQSMYTKVIAMPDPKLAQRGKFNLGILQIKRGNYQQAMTWFDQLPAEEDPEVLLQVAKIYIDLGDIARAVASYRQLESLHPDYFYAYFELGLLQFKQRLFPEAASQLERASILNPNDFQVWYNLGAARWNLGQYDSAKEAWKRAEKLSPEDAALQELKGKVKF